MDSEEQAICDALAARAVELERVNAHCDAIGQAKGILMVTSNVGADDAFALLITASQRENRKVRDIAAEIAGRYPLGGAGDRPSG